MLLSPPFSKNQRVVQLGDPNCSAFKKFADYQQELYQNCLEQVKKWQEMVNASANTASTPVEVKEEDVASPVKSEELELEPSPLYYEALRHIQFCTLYEDPKFVDTIHLYLFHPDSSKHLPQVLKKQYVTDWSLFQKKCATEGMTFVNAAKKWNKTLRSDERQDWVKFSRKVKLEQAQQIEMGYIRIV